jgi:hypothetical protein
VDEETILQSPTKMLQPQLLLRENFETTNQHFCQAVALLQRILHICGVKPHNTLRLDETYSVVENITLLAIALDLEIVSEPQTCLDDLESSLRETASALQRTPCTLLVEIGANAQSVHVSNTFVVDFVG